MQAGTQPRGGRSGTGAGRTQGGVRSAAQKRRGTPGGPDWGDLVALGRGTALDGTWLEDVQRVSSSEDERMRLSREGGRRVGLYPPRRPESQAPARRPPSVAMSAADDLAMRYPARLQLQTPGGTQGPRFYLDHAELAQYTLPGPRPPRLFTPSLLEGLVDEREPVPIRAVETRQEATSVSGLRGSLRSAGASAPHKAMFRVPFAPSHGNFIDAVDSWISIDLEGSAPQQGGDLEGRSKQSVTSAEEAIRFYSSGGAAEGGSPKAFYCNYARGGGGYDGAEWDPYELVVVPHHQTDPEHYVISSSSIMHIVPEDPSEMFAFDEWLRHRMTFNIIRNICFFRNFYIMRAFQNWRANVRAQLFLSRQETISASALPLLPIFGPSLQRINNALVSFSDVQRWDREVGGTGWRLRPQLARGGATRASAGGGTLMHRLSTFRTEAPCMLHEFRELRLQRVREGQRSFDDLIATVRAEIARAKGEVQRVTEALESDTGAELSETSRRGRWRSESMTFRKEAKRKSQARQQQAENVKLLLSRYIRTLDALVVRGVLAFAADACNIFQEELRVGRKISLFNVVGATNLGLHDLSDIQRYFEPPADALSDALAGVLNSVFQLASNVERISERDSDFVERCFIPIGEILSHSLPFEELYTRARDTLGKDYNAAMLSDTVQRFKAADTMHAFASVWTEREYQKRGPTPDDFCQDITGIRKWREDLSRGKNVMISGMVHVDTSRLKAMWLSPAVKALEGLTSLLAGKFIQHCKSVTEWLQIHSEELQCRPDDLSAFAVYVTDTKNHTDADGEMKQHYLSDISTAQNLQELLSQGGPQGPWAPGGECQEWWGQTERMQATYIESCSKAHNFMESFKPTAIEMLLKEASMLSARLQVVITEVRNGPSVRADEEPVAVLRGLAECSQNIEKESELARRLVMYQTILSCKRLGEMEKTLDGVKIIIARHVALWEAWEQWRAFDLRLRGTNVLHGEFIMSDEIDHHVGMLLASTSIQKLEVRESDHQYNTPLEDGFISTMEREALLWKEHSSALRYTCSEAMKYRHWIAVLREAGRPAPHRLTTKNLLEWGVLTHPSLVRVWTRSQREAELEGQLHNLMEEVKANDLLFSEDLAYKMWSCQRATNVHEILQVLRQARKQLSGLSCSPHLPEIIEVFQEVEANILHICNTLDAVAECQSTWELLAKIFSHEAYFDYAPGAGLTFKTATQSWNSLVVSMSEAPGVFECCTITTLEECQRLQQELSAVTRRCSDILGAMRKTFPRLYFADDISLMHVAASISPRDIDFTQLEAVFSGLTSITFNADVEGGNPDAAETWEVTAAHFGNEISLEMHDCTITREQLPETWLATILEGLNGGIKQSFEACLRGCAAMKPLEWSTTFPSQCVLLVDDVVWTDTVSAVLNSMSSGNKFAMQNLFQQTTRRVENIRKTIHSLMFEAGHNMTQQEIQACLRSQKALVITGIEHRDFADSLNGSQVSGIDDYEWLKQMRHYWDLEAKECTVHTGLLSKIAYGFECLGDSVSELIAHSRSQLLNVASLTGQSPFICLQNCAMRPNISKSLAAAYGQHCPAVRCVAKTDMSELGRILDGIASTAAWACFYNFDVLATEVISQLALELNTIKELAHLDNPQVRWGDFNCFVTCSETAQEKNVAEMAAWSCRSLIVPEAKSAVVLEAALGAYGFPGPSALASKTLQFFQSIQHHMPLEECFKEMPQIVRAIVSYIDKAYIDKACSTEDVLPLLKESVSTLWVSSLDEAKKLAFWEYWNVFEMDAGLASEIKQPEIAATRDIMLNMLRVQKCVVITGVPGSGKSKLIRDVVGIGRVPLNKMSRNFSGYHSIGAEVAPRVFYPGAMPVEAILGNFDGSVWRDGKLAEYLRTPASPDTHYNAFVLDGVLSAPQMEAVLHLLENSHVTLPNGEEIHQTDFNKILVETTGVEGMSPALAGAVGIVHCHPDVIPLAAVVEEVCEEACQWCATSWIPQDALVSAMRILPQIAASVIEVEPSLKGTGGIAAVRRSGYLLQQLATSSPDAILVLSQEERTLFTHKIFVYSVCWAFGGSQLHTARQKIQIRVLNAVPAEWKLSLPDGLSLFEDCVIDFHNFSFTRWADEPGDGWSVGNDVGEIIIPTRQARSHTFVTRCMVDAGLAPWISGSGLSSSASIIRTALSGSFRGLKSMDVVSCRLNGYGTIEDINRTLGAQMEDCGKDLIRPKYGGEAVIFIEDLHLPHAVCVRRSERPAEACSEVSEWLRQLMDCSAFYANAQSCKRVISKAKLVVSGTACDTKSNTSFRRLGRFFDTLNVDEGDWSENASWIFSYLSDAHLPRFLSHKTRSLIVTGCEAVLREIVEVVAASSLKTSLVKELLRSISAAARHLVGKGSIDGVSYLRNFICLWVHECSFSFRRVSHVEQQERLSRSLVEAAKDIALADSPHGAQPSVANVESDIRRALEHVEVSTEGIVSLLDTEIIAEEVRQGLYSSEMENGEHTDTEQLGMADFLKQPHLISNMYHVVHQLRKNDVCVMVTSTCGTKAMATGAARLLGSNLVEIAVCSSLSVEGVWQKLLDARDKSCEKTLVYVEEKAAADRDVLGAVVTFFQNPCFSRSAPGGFKLLLNLSEHQYAAEQASQSTLFSQASVLHVPEASDNEMFKTILDTLRANEALVDDAVEFGWHVPSVSWSLVQIHHSAVEKWDSALPGAQISQQSMWNCLKMFEAQIERRLHTLREKAATLRCALHRFNEAQRQAQEATKSIDLVEPRLGNVVSNSMESVLNISELERLGDALNIENFNDEIKCKKWVTKMEEMKLSVDAAIGNATEKYVSSLTQVLALAEKDIIELRSYNSPPGLVRIVVESVCVLFNVDKSWKAARKFIADKEVPILDRVEMFNLDGVSQDTFEELDTYVSLPNFKPSAVEQVSQAAKSVCEWVLAVHGYALATKEAKETGIRLHEIRAQKESSEDKIAQRKLALEEIRAQLSILQHKHAQLLSQQGSLESERGYLNDKVEVLMRFIKDFSQQAKLWQEEYSDVRRSLNESLGSSILMSAYMVYSSAMLPEDRRTCVREWAAMLASQGIKSRPDFDVVSHSSQQHHLPHLSLNSELQAIDCENIILLDLFERDCHKIVLLVDPDGVATMMAESLYPDITWQYAAADTHSGSCDSLDYALQTVSGGKNMLLEIGKLSPALVGDLRAGLSRMRDRGRLVLFTRSASPSLFHTAHEDIAIINCERDHAAVEATLLNAAVKTANETVQIAASELQEALAAKRTEHRCLQNDILDNLCGGAPTMWLTVERLNILIDMKCKHVQLEDEIASTMKDLVGNREDEERWVAVAKMLRNLYFRFRQFSLGLDSDVPVWPVWQYEKICSCIVEAVSHELGEKAFDEIGVLSAVCRHLYAHLCFRFGHFGEVSFGLVLALGLQVIKGCVSAEESLFLQEVLMKETTAPKDTLAELKRYPGGAFDLFMDEIREHLNNAEDVDVFKGTNTILCMTSKGKPIFESLSDFHRVVLLATCFKKFAFLAIQRFVRHTVQPEADPDQSTALCTAASVFSSRTPILLYGCEGEKCAHPLRYAGNLFKEMNAVYSPTFGVTFQSMGSGNFAALRDALREAWEKGKWLVILEGDANPVWSTALVREMDCLAEEIPEHEFFKLWICTDESRLGHCPPDLLCRCSVFALERISSAQHGVVRAFESLEGENKKIMNLEGEEPAAWRKHAFGLSLLHAVLKMRQSYGDLGYHGRVAWNDQDFQSGLNICRALFAPKMFPETTKPHLFDYTAINSLIMDTLTPCLENTWDRRCCRSLIDKFVTHDILTPSYIVCHPNQALGTMPPSGTILEIRDFVDVVLASAADQEAFSSVSLDLQTQVREAEFSKRILCRRVLRGSEWHLQSSQVLEKFSSDLSSVKGEVESALGKLEQHSPSDSTESSANTTGDATAIVLGDCIDSLVRREISALHNQLEALMRTIVRIREHITAGACLPSLLSEAARSFLADRMPAGSVSGPRCFDTMAESLSHFHRKAELLTLWLTQEKPALNLGMFSEPEVVLTELKQVYAEASGVSAAEIFLSGRIMNAGIISMEDQFVSQDGGGTAQAQADSKTEGQWSLPIAGVHLCGARWDKSNKYLADIKGSRFGNELPTILLTFATERPEQDLNHFVCPVYIAMRTRSSRPPRVLWGLEMKSRRNVDFWLRKGVAAYAAV